MSLNRENGSGHHYLISACNEASISPYIAMGPSLDPPGTDRGQSSSSQTTPRLEIKNIDTSFPPSVSSSRTQTLSCSMPRRDQLLSPASPLLKQSDAILRGTQLSQSSESHLLFPEPSSATSPPSTPRRDGSRTPRPHHHAELLSALNSPNISDLTKMFSTKIGDFIESLSDSEDESSSPISRLKTLPSASSAQSPLHPGKKGLLRTVPLPAEDEEDPKDPYIYASPRPSKRA
ncbi:hypothetical protein VKT23_006637 [Stygiomarasmius scandens]|uniref:Uncharacterized protein n=1 Tax=Marasmiellus scandens TaxID=2682957 RepID=A0ABR1JPP5_9AGAR